MLLAPFRYSCFISFSYGDGLMRQFVIELKQLLENYQRLYLKEPEVYLDLSRMEPGAMIAEGLAQALCQSLCMVVVYTPPYEEQDWCLQEYAAMEDLERRRLDLIRPILPDASLIIPVMLRIDDQVPSRIRGVRNYHDFSRVYLDYKEIAENRNYLEEIDKISLRVRRLHNAFRQAEPEPSDCSAFALPPPGEALFWTPPFPGRGAGR